MSKGSHPKDASGNYLVPSRVPQYLLDQVWENRPYKEDPTTQDYQDTLARIEKSQAIHKEAVWQPVKGTFPRLVFETRNQMDDYRATDMLHGDESQETIESYGFTQPFQQNKYTIEESGGISSGETGYGYSIQAGEDPFRLPAKEHFERMRYLSEYFSSSFVAGLLSFKTSEIFSQMVDKFEQNRGGYYTHPALDEALKNHESTRLFHQVLKDCLSENIKEGVLDKDIIEITNQYMRSTKGVGLPGFDYSFKDLSAASIYPLLDGTILAVHGIWSMQVYIDSLEYKGDQVRGKFTYHIQDHFGLNAADIDATGGGRFPPYELLKGFRSWYLLQHYQGYNYQPLITYIRFAL